MKKTLLIRGSIGLHGDVVVIDLIFAGRKDGDDHQVLKSTRKKWKKDFYSLLADAEKGTA